jgi:Holliday junction DNA helicase RuvB
MSKKDPSAEKPEAGRLVDPQVEPEDESLYLRLRPQLLDEFIGKEALKEGLSISIQAASRRGEPVPHVLLYGPPGLGKTTLANIVAHSMGVHLFAAPGPVLERPGDLVGVLKELKRGDVLFIDEIHRVPRVVEEYLYSAMEQFEISVVLDRGQFARPIPIPVNPFTLVGATTRAGLLTAPLRQRFGISYHLDFYSEADLALIIKRSAGILGVTITDDGAGQLARRSRGTPRIANRLLQWVRDYSLVRADGRITQETVDTALAMQGIDHVGLDALDRRLLRTIIDFYQGGPVGIEALAATLNEESDTLVDMVEPFLLKIGFLSRTPSGRKATEMGYRHFDLQVPEAQRRLL